ncbi:MAG: RuBisCO large subunit C-terminal-like domain-containing protein [Candidatus Goldiibacteriota bacterium]
MSGIIRASYYIETPYQPEKMAELMAKMQSAGTWSRVKGEDDKKMEPFAAKVAGIEKTGETDLCRLPTRDRHKGPYNCVNVDIDFPAGNIGPNIALVLTTAAGEIFDLMELTAVKLKNLIFPDEFLNHFPGPGFGINGSREAAKAYDRPLFGAITKPCVGLTPDEIAFLAGQAALAGADFIKDDELLGDPLYNRIEDRAKAVCAALKEAEQKTGKPCMYAFNVTDDPDKVIKNHDIAVKNGAKAVLFNVAAGGFNTLKMLAEHTRVPIHCHRDFAVASIRSPYLGISPRVFTKITRMCGGDQLQVGGIDGYIYETDDEILESFEVCTEETGSIAPALPVSSGGMWAGKLPVNIRRIGGLDFMFLCGGGVFGHPDGGYAGMRSLFAAYEAYKKGMKLEDSGDRHLKRAVEEFGNVVY